MVFNLYLCCLLSEWWESVLFGYFLAIVLKFSCLYYFLELTDFSFFSFELEIGCLFLGVCEVLLLSIEIDFAIVGFD